MHSQDCVTLQFCSYHRGLYVNTCPEIKGISEKDNMRLIVILERTYDFLEEELSKAFDAQSDVIIVVDRRFGERRQRKDLISPERRHGDRRRPKGHICKVVISG